MDETVTVWEEGRRIEPTMIRAWRCRSARAETTPTLEPNGEGTLATLDYRYVPRGGPRPHRTTHWPIDRQDAHRDLHRHADYHRAGRSRGPWRALTACF